MTASPSPRMPGGSADAADRGPSLRMRLRNGTRTAHEGLDARFEALGEGRAGRDYARFLRMNEACLRVLEPILRDSGVFERLLGTSIAPRARAATADLETLGLRPMVPAAFAIAEPDFPQAIGIAYVLEGSRLGARQILKRLARLDNGGAIPTCFLRSAGDAEHFRSFMEAAESAATTERDRSRVVGAANSTFDFFIGALRQAEAAPDSDE